MIVLLASKLSGLGLSDTMVKAVLAIALAAVSGVLVAVFPDKSWVAPIAGALVAISALIDPNASH